MAKKTASRGAKKGGGRRANYAPANSGSGVLPSKYRPVGWANWLGFVMFGLLTFALAAETVAGVAEGRGADPIAAGVMTIAFAAMTYLFATTRMRD